MGVLQIGDEAPIWGQDVRTLSSCTCLLACIHFYACPAQDEYPAAERWTASVFPSPDADDVVGAWGCSMGVGDESWWQAGPAMSGPARRAGLLGGPRAALCRMRSLSLCPAGDFPLQRLPVAGQAGRARHRGGAARQCSAVVGGGGGRGAARRAPRRGCRLGRQVEGGRRRRHPGGRAPRLPYSPGLHIPAGAAAGQGAPFDALNALAAGALLHALSSSRFGGAQGWDLGQLSASLAPYPRLHFLLAGVAPLRDAARQAPGRALDQVSAGVAPWG